MNKLIFGFDPGNSSGAVVCLVIENSKIIESESLPFPVILSKKSTGRTHKELDIQKVYNLCLSILSSHKSQFPEIIFICEKVNAMPKQGSVSIFSFGDGYGQIKALCRIFNIYVRSKFILIRPQEWKAKLLKGTPRDKGAGEQFIRDQYPMIDLCCNRNGKPHMGVVDAACIALYGLYNT